MPPYSTPLMAIPQTTPGTYGKTAEAKILIWTAMRQSATFSVRDLATWTGLPDRTIYDYVQGLFNADYLVCESEYDPRGPLGNISIYRLERDTGAHPPRMHRGKLIDPNLNPAYRDKRDLLWQAIRELRRFDSAQLTAIVEQHQGAISRYLKFLTEAGYLRVLRRNESGKAGSWTLYQLIQDTGPFPPMRRRDGSLFDPNLYIKETL